MGAASHYRRSLGERYLAIPKASSYVLRFANSGNPQLDQTNFLDALFVVRNGVPDVNTYLKDGNFELHQVSGNAYSPGPFAEWQFDGGSGLSAGFAFGQPNHEGNQVAFLQGTSATLTQVLLLPPGLYQLGIPVASRSGTVDLLTTATLNGIGLWSSSEAGVPAPPNFALTYSKKFRIR